MTYLAFDPGETTGYFIFNDDGSDKDLGQLKGEEELFQFLTTVEKPQLIIMEVFRLFGHKALQQSGSNMFTSLVEGMVKLWARQHSIPVVEQPASILPIAQLWSGVSLKGDHSKSHYKSAFNHGVYYLQSNGIRKSRVPLA